MTFSQKMLLYSFYTMVQKSQKWPKTQSKGGPALNLWNLDIGWQLTDTAQPAIFTELGTRNYAWWKPSQDRLKVIFEGNTSHRIFSMCECLKILGVFLFSIGCCVAQREFLRKFQKFRMKCKRTQAQTLRDRHARTHSCTNMRAWTHMQIVKPCSLPEWRYTEANCLEYWPQTITKAFLLAMHVMWEKLQSCGLQKIGRICLELTQLLIFSTLLTENYKPCYWSTRASTPTEGSGDWGHTIQSSGWL